MNILLSGGCKNGKSSIAERLTVRLAGDGPRYYVATMIPHDEEDRARIRRHVSERCGLGFETLERGLDIGGCADGRENGTFLLDSVTALLSNEMFPPTGEPDFDAPQRVAEGLRRFAAAAGNAIFVSDYIFGDAERYDDLTEVYRRGLALLDRTLAALSDTVLEVCAGNPILHKGGLPR
ncbi:MAG: bifunctional adenosylcobinamide kinase/adenosylcobinamide-phosphate guanylyltransferase [Oscillospiraceae bacterium]|nr:bifunctional adenosylcobinamide kinase/adenosylcobinamide-phosphate guanylyltransferase [Oscillospiraceae bacterium]